MSNHIFDIILAQDFTKLKTEKQQRLIETAIKLFAEKGYANTSTAEIAKVAGVSEGLIFKQYGTKDRLLLSVILPFIKDLFPVMANEMLSEIISEDTISFEQFLRNLLINRALFITENKEIFQVVVKEVIYNEDLKRELLPYFFTKIPLFLTDVLEQFKERGELIHLPTERIFKMLFTVIGGFLVSRLLLMENHIIPDEEIEDIVQLVVNGLKNKQFVE